MESNFELIEYVFSDTKTLKLMDAFDGIEEGTRPYQRLVIRNRCFGYAHNQAFHYQLVIERGEADSAVGDITMTELKKGNTKELRDHVRSEITKTALKQYKGRHKFFRFRKPFRLRAQNSSNRTGYGWTWYWSSYGFSTCIEGTEYGETNDYLITGVYLYD